MNPTNGGYEFVWNCADGQLTNQLRCLTPRGHVAAGKKAEVIRTNTVFQYYCGMCMCSVGV